MRQEAESVIEEHGWTKAAMQKMHKIDSFLKESQRLNSMGSSKDPNLSCYYCRILIMDASANDS